MRDEIEARRRTVQQLEREAAALLRAIEAKRERARLQHLALAARARSDAWRWN
jgi:hypothetical protein